MVQFVEAIPHLLLRIFAPVLGVCLVAWLIVLFIPFVRKQVRPVFSVSEGRGGRFPPVQWVVLFLVMVACTLFSGKNTNGVQNVGGGHLFQFSPPLVQIVSPQDVSNGWRVAEESGAEIFALPPAGAVTNENWRLRGAHDDAFRIPADGWSYPYTSGITVLSRGELRASIHSHDFPRPFDQDLSIVPYVNWPQLPEGRRESVFWYDATPSNTLLTTWWNAALGRDATNPVNFQAELFPDGGFTYRYEDRTVRHARVWPFDWDDDGLENTVDPDPLTPGPDAHGTNAEWYNTVCSNVLEAVATSCNTHGEGTRSCASVELSWRADVNSNAYYFVDVVTERGPAPIYFLGDRESRLGNPVLVARAFETNRVPLLIGIDYAITSPVPFTVSYPMEYMYPELETNELCHAHIRWPLGFSVTLDGYGGYYVTAIPYDPGGTFQWGNGGAGGMRSGGVRSGDSGSSSCEYSFYGNWLGFMCAGSDCGCHGCSVDGTYTMECSTFNLPTLFCGCSYDDPPDDPPDEPPDEPYSETPSVSITFSQPALIFEDRYEASPNSWVEKRSTTNTLTVTASGGASGATLILSTANLECLQRVGGGSVSLPAQVVLGPYMSYEATFRCEGAGNGGTPSVGGIISGPDGTDVDYAQTTVVKVEIQHEREAPENENLNRHDYGIGEWMYIRQFPMSPGINVSAPDAVVRGGSTQIIMWGVSNVEHSLSCSLYGVEYKPLVRVLKPTGIEGYDAQAYTNGLPPGVAGGLHLVQRYRVLPLTVNFTRLRIEEVPCYDPIPLTGYFIYTSPNKFPRTHTRDAGAGEWFFVDPGNLVGASEDGRDKAGCKVALTRRMPDGTPTDDPSYGWLGGDLPWKVPFGWKHRDSSAIEPVGIFAEDTRQILSITESGDFSVHKLQHTATRQLDGTITVDGHADDGILDN